MLGIIREVMDEYKITNVTIDWIEDEFVADYARTHSINYLVRGLRNDIDYRYEEQIAKNNREINPELNTVYLRADNEIISSSFVKMMFNNNKDISKYVPAQVEKYMKGVKDFGNNWHCSN
jgi:pantetheine-phosphate adenylyltransferase